MKMMYVMAAALLLLCNVVVISAKCPAVKPTKLDCRYVKVGMFCGKDTGLDCAEGEECCTGICGGRYCYKEAAKGRVADTILPMPTNGCPKVNPLIRCIRRGDVLCKSDLDCLRTQRCCDTICNGRACYPKYLEPVIDPPVLNICPDVMTIDCTTAKFANQCMGDKAGSCASDEFCCPGACGGSYCHKIDATLNSARLGMPALDASIGVSANICAQPKVVGMCKAAFPRFWFNLATKKCEKFIYGGCGGNSNNFLTLLDCQKTCISVDTSVCAYFDPQIVCVKQGDRQCETNSECGFGNTCCPTECGGTQCSGGLIYNPPQIA